MHATPLRPIGLFSKAHFIRQPEWRVRYVPKADFSMFAVLAFNALLRC